MTEELDFNIELKKCLNTAAFPDDLWDWWYQRLHQAHDQAVDGVTEAQRSENAKLRELVRDSLRPKYDDTLRMPPAKWREYDADVLRRARELGIEVDK